MCNKADDKLAINSFYYTLNWVNSIILNCQSQLNDTTINFVRQVTFVAVAKIF